MELGGLEGYKTSRIPHYLGNQHTDGGEIVSITRWPRFTPKKDSWYSFLLEAEKTPGPSAAGKIRLTEKKITSSGFEPTTFRLTPQCLNQLRYLVPQELFRQLQFRSNLVKYNNTWQRTWIQLRLPEKWFIAQND
jgi:hypothetical protein